MAYQMGADQAKVAADAKGSSRARAPAARSGFEPASDLDANILLAGVAAGTSICPFTDEPTVN